MGLILNFRLSRFCFVSQRIGGMWNKLEVGDKLEYATPSTHTN